MNVKEECPREDEELNEPKVDGRKKKGRRSNMEKKNHAESEETEVRRLAFCDLHSPLDLENKKNLEDLHKAGRNFYYAINSNYYSGLNFSI